MKDVELQERLDEVEHLMQRFEEDGLEKREGEQLLEEGMARLEAAKELLDLGSGKLVQVDEVDGAVVDEPLEFDG